MISMAIICHAMWWGEFDLEIQSFLVEYPRNEVRQMIEKGCFLPIKTYT